MKKLKKLLVLFTFLFMALPIFANAATELASSSPNPIVGKQLYIQLEANYGDKLRIRDFHIYLEYDNSFLEIEEIKWIKSRSQMGEHKIDNNRIYVDKTDGNWASGPVLQVIFNVKKSGTTKIDVVETKRAYYTDGTPVAQTTAGIIINPVNPDSNTRLQSLYVKGYDMIPIFKPSRTKYTVDVDTNVSEIEIVAKKSNELQTITGHGKKTLRLGANKFRVIVTAQNDSTQTYEILVNRKDNRQGDTTLKTLTVTETAIKYQKDKTTYEATVSRSVEKILISARTNDPLATLIGTGTKELKIGLNEFKLEVTSSAGKSTIYTIKITRSTEELEGPVTSSKLKTLKVNSLVLNIKEDNNLFLYGINKNISELTIEAIPKSQTAKVEIIGNKKLKEGISLVTIKVTEILEEATEDTEEVTDITEYKILVYKGPTDAEVISSIEEIKDNKDYTITTLDNKTHLIPKNYIEILTNNKKTLYYNVVNIYNGLLYRVKLPTMMELKDYDLKLNKIESGDITYKTNLPTDSEITTYLDNAYEDGTTLKVYSYNEEGTYTLVTEGIEVTNGYVTFNTNGETYYVITQMDLIHNQSEADKLMDTIKKVGIIVVVIIIGIIILPKVFKKKQKEDNEPLY